MVLGTQLQVAEQQSPCGQAQGWVRCPCCPWALQGGAGCAFAPGQAPAGSSYGHSWWGIYFLKYLSFISWNIYLLNNWSSWLVVVLLVEAAVVHSECDRSVGNPWHLVFFIVPDAGQWPGNTQGGRQQPPLKTHEETAAPGTWILPSSLSAVPPSLLVTNYLSQGFLIFVFGHVTFSSCWILIFSSCPQVTTNCPCDEVYCQIFTDVSYCTAWTKQRVQC